MSYQYRKHFHLSGCPSPGYYGDRCSLECPQNCQDGYCDIVEGTCFGCTHGYIGPTCTKGRCPFSHMILTLTAAHGRLITQYI